MQITEKSKIGEIVRVNFQTAPLFEQHQIDFCCGGGISLEKACSDRNLNLNQMLDEVNKIVSQADPDSQHIENMPLDELCGYIEKTHHSYIYQTVPFLQVKLQKLCDVHGANHPELFEIKLLFDGASDALTEHLKMEESIVFPAIRKMTLMQSPLGISGDFDQTLELMLEDHQTEGDRFERIAKLSGSYSCPPDGCNTFRVTYETLQAFERDLHRHIHLENNILFIKALALFKELKKSN